MKTSSRFTKAAAVVILLGIGVLRNVENKSTLLEPINQITSSWNTDQVETDEFDTADKVVLLSKLIIKTGIQHLTSIL